MVGLNGTIAAPLVERNEITLDRAYAAISFGGNVSSALVSNNRMRGDGLIGLELFSFAAGQRAVRNTATGNNLTRFTGELADVFLDAHTERTLLLGMNGVVVDHGVGNEYTGMSRITPGDDVGERMRRPSALGSDVSVDDR